VSPENGIKAIDNVKGSKDSTIANNIESAFAEVTFSHLGFLNIVDTCIN